MSPALPVRARLDDALRLVEADPPIAALQRAAGAAVDGMLAPPQLAGIARIAKDVGEPVSRLAHVATPDGDAQLWVRVEPVDGGFVLEVERWRPLEPAEQRFDAVVPTDEKAPEAANDDRAILVDERLRILSVGKDLERWFGGQVGRSFVRVVRFSEDEAGDLPIVEALATREAFAGTAVLSEGGRNLELSGDPQYEEGRFAGFRITVALADEPAAATSQGETGGLDATLRSPLDRIIKAADQIVDRSDGPIRSDYADYAGDIATAGRHLLSVIRSMSEQVGVERERVKLSVVAREAAGLVAAKARDKRVDIEIEDDLSVVAIGERRAILQILVNILGNAIRHSPDDGTVAIVFDTLGERATVTVADQGPGIARTDQAKIFEKFERLDAEEGTGAGLGLAISRRLARSMDGEIALESAIGEGARFTLSLPAAT